MNFRERVERDLAVSLEGRWGLPVALTGPDGVRQAGLTGQVLYDIVRLNPETGEDVVVSTPVVTLRRSSLDRVPQAGENWIVEIPSEPRVDAPLVQYALSTVRPPEGGKSIGFIRLYLQQVEQS
jgi:hypothetical protein